MYACPIGGKFFDELCLLMIKDSGCSELLRSFGMQKLAGIKYGVPNGTKLSIFDRLRG